MLAGYGVYWAALQRQRIRPSRASWLIWSGSLAVEAATYRAVNPGALQDLVFFASALACALVTFAIWRRSSWAPPTRTETACVLACGIALILWLAFRSAFWAHMLVVAMVPVSFWPTWASIAVDPRHERSPAWALWTVGDLATLALTLAAGTTGVALYAYVAVELACHASVCAMVGLAGVRPLRARRRGGAVAMAARYRTPHPFAVRANHLGKAVYAAQAFGEGDRLMRFTGRRLRADRVPGVLSGKADRYVQITPEHYMGPSGRLDDLVNHSCQPNAGLRFAADGVWLIAIRPIAPGDEIAWDYSTTLLESNWHMICQCRSTGCRRVIGNFATLSPERQEWFRARNLVPPYLRRRDAVEEPTTRRAVG